MPTQAGPTFQAWLVAVGQHITVGDPLAEIETEKAVVEYASEVEGMLARLVAEPGVVVAVGDPIAVVFGPGETLANDGRRLFATPLVRKLAQERGISLDAVKGTSPGGRVVRRDLDRLTPPPELAPPPAPSPVAAVTAAPLVACAGYIDIPLTGMRKAIARRLTESKTTVPHFYVTADCRVDRLMELRRTINETAARKVSLNDFVLKAVAGTLVEVPEANAIWNGNSIRRFDVVDISVAVAVDGGLLTPVLRAVETMALSALSAEVAALAARARTGRIQQHELQGEASRCPTWGCSGSPSSRRS